MNIYSAIVTIFALWAVVRVSQHWAEGRRAARQEGDDDPRAAEIERLEQRVRTLERIVTDDSERLRHKFDELE